VAVSGCSVAEDKLSPFDVEKAKLLSPVKRQAYDLRFFNEMYSRMVLTGEPDAIRQVYREMAEDGFEIAHLALRLYDMFHRHWPRHEAGALSRLKELAAQGDLSAKCFYGRFAWRADYSKYDRMEILPYVIDAADGGHPSCTGAFASWLRGDEPLPQKYQLWIQIHQDPEARLAKALELEQQAARAGDLGSQSSFALKYQLGKYVPQDFGRARCWASIAVRTSRGAPVIANDAIALEQTIRRAIAVEKYEASLVRKYSEDSWCTEIVAE
jgi:TPR repeat protein